ncbi:hypothetical protein HYV81_02005 [Candidatus Woesearchaeota archaeon]|nr:hypothetical protein [Candidatus Woesearchaeota archaeon]
MKINYLDFRNSSMYTNSDGQALALLNRDNWDVSDEDLEDINIYELSSHSGKEREQIRKDRKLGIKTD